MRADVARYVYDTETRDTGRSGAATVLADHGDEVAAVGVEKGGLRRGPTWTWSGVDGQVWTLRARRNARTYEIRHADGREAGQVSRARRGGVVRIRTADGTTVETRRGFLSKERAFELPDGQGHVAISQHTPGGWRTGRDRWRLEMPRSVHDDLETVLLALPLVLDHYERQRDSGD